MLKRLTLLALIAFPNSVQACFSCCSTYDLTHPGIFGFKHSPTYEYVLGRVSKVERGESSLGNNSVLVTIDVLEDYRYPQGQRTVQAFANGTKTCGPQIKLGQYSKFAVDRQRGEPWLISASYSFF